MHQLLQAYSMHEILPSCLRHLRRQACVQSPLFFLFYPADKQKSQFDFHAHFSTQGIPSQP